MEGRGRGRGVVYSYQATKMKADIILVWPLDTKISVSSQLQVSEKPAVV